MAPKKMNSDAEPFLFEDMPPRIDLEPTIAPLSRPIWTQNKATLIAEYLRLFVYITRHGTYIDGFAGPQEPDMPSMWAAELVLGIRPKLMRNFYLFDRGREQIKALRSLKSSQPAPDESRREPTRQIRVIPGDFNKKIVELLNSHVIRENEATFCLLDQRTFECDWATLEALAGYRASNHKIELFYFLPNSWFDRAAKQLKSDEVLKRWWGRDDWSDLRWMKRQPRRELLQERFKSELGYRSVKAWPIYERETRGNIMYYMIHATDHPEAPKLMRRAYGIALRSTDKSEQLELYPLGSQPDVDRNR